tara:strand:- start:4302 stop:4775 length:474 start_codon:yes stop_codon:yes gene_type:complete
MYNKLYLVIITILIFSDLVWSNDDIGYKFYEKGQYDKAFKIWNEEIVQGNKEALYNIGLLYYFGKGVDKNLSLAFNYCKKAAFKGLARAQNNLAFMYMEGMGTKKSYISAYAWSVIAIKNGYNAQGIKDDAKINMTPAMLIDAKKLIVKINKEIEYE